MQDCSDMRVGIIVPAFQAQASIGPVVRGLKAHWPEAGAVLVVDDGSTDETSPRAREAGAEVLRHPENRGKGEALRTGLQELAARGFDVAVSVDADGQHPPDEAWLLHIGCDDPNAMVIGVRDLADAGAPRNNQWSNAFSNRVLSAFTGQRLDDTQSGLRRYPITKTLALHGRARGYAYEAEVLIRAIAAEIRIVHIPIDVIYPPEDERISHFHQVRDPARIVVRVVSTVLEERWRKLFRRRKSKLSPSGTAHELE